MVNQAKRGQRKEYLARKELEEDGWKIGFKSIRWRYGTFDLFSLFDILAYKENERMYISVKHLGKSNFYKPHQQQINDFANEFALSGESFHLWLWDKPRWQGRGKDKVWNKGGFHKIVVWSE